MLGYTVVLQRGFATAPYSGYGSMGRNLFNFMCGLYGIGLSDFVKLTLRFISLPHDCRRKFNSHCFSADFKYPYRILKMIWGGARNPDLLSRRDRREALKR